MKNLFFLIIALMFSVAALAQLNGIYHIPSGNPSFPTIAAAISALNSQGVGSGGVTFLVATGHTETITDSLVLTASGKVSGSIIFQKSGAGNNPLITRTDGGSKATSTLGGQGDAVITLQGTDYVTFDGIDVAATLQGIEYGYYLRKADATDGCKYVTIKNAAVTMNKGTSAYVAGIYLSNNIPTSTISSATGVTVTSVGGRNESISITGNNISNVFTGIILRGYNHTSAPYDFYDQNVVVGASGVGNTIRNFAGNTASTSYGVYLIYQNGANVSYNVINNTGGGGTAATAILYGIFHSTGTTSSFTTNSNTINLTQGGATHALYGINNAATGNPVFDNNNVTLNSSVSTTGTFGYIYNSGGAASTLISISGNTFSGSSFMTTGTTYLIYNSVSQLTPGISNIANNSTSGTITRGGASGIFYCYYVGASPTGTENISGNNFSNIVVTGTSTFYGVNSNTVTGHTQNVFNNIITNITGGSGTIYGINLQAANTRSVYGNDLNTFNGGGTIYGISVGTGSASCNVYKNKIYNFTATPSGGIVYGIYVSAGTTMNIYNNYISDLKAPTASGTNAIIGINISGGTTANAFYNTVFLNATSSAGSFGTSTLYVSSTTTLDLRNNILVNKSDHAGSSGFTVAFRRSGVYNATYYANISNTNNFYALSSSPVGNYIFYDGINKDSTMTDYKTLVAPRDAGSFSEIPPFVNTATAPYDLHLLTTTTTQCESGGTPVSSPIAVNDDYDNHPRYPNPGYPDNPAFPASAPDVGADEFAGMPSFSCTTPNPGNTIASASGICLGQNVVLSLQNPIVGTGNSYQWKSSADGVTFTNIANANGGSYTATPVETTWYQCVVTCQNGPSAATSIAVQVTFANNITSTTPAIRCGTGTVTLAATAGSGTLKWYPSASGGFAVGTGSPFTTPVINATTTYFVGAETSTSGIVSVGAGATSSSTYPNPFYSLWSNTHNQYLITSAELMSAGIAGGDITSLAIEITSGVMAMLDFSIKMGHTTATNMSSFLSPSFTAVYTAATQTPTIGVNTMLFQTPFTWDGVSNIVIEICHGNSSSSSTMSSTCLADNSSFVSTIHVQKSASSAGSITCADFTTNLATYSVRPKFTFGGFVACSSPRSAVTATVTPSPALTITGNKTVCSNEVAILSVTSQSSFFDVFLWSPATNLYTDPACVIPYNGVSSALTLYAKSAAPVVTTYTCNATNTSTLCSNTAQTVFTSLPSTPVITATPETICISGSAAFTVSPATGYGAATFQWQNSPDGIAFTDISGATNLNYTTAILGATTYYKLTIKNGAGQECVTPFVTATVNNPMVNSTAPGSHCGPGSVTLGATGSGGTLNWYSTTTGGTALATGSSFVTPVITSTTPYYVSSNSPGSATVSVGAPGNGATETYTLEGGLLFNVVSQSVLINGVYIYPIGTGAGTVNVALKNSSGTILQSLAFNCTGTTLPGIKTYIPLDWTVQMGTDYFLDMTSRTGSVASLIRDASANIIGGPFATNPYCTYPGAMTITSGRLGATGTISAYYYFYDWSVTVGCNSPRVPVIATITTPPTLTITSDKTLCSDEILSLSVTSMVAEYDSYSWSPVTNLFTNAACTIPYLPNVNASAVYVKSAAAIATTYICTGNNSQSLCSNTAQSTITVIATNPLITSSPETICMSGSAIISLTSVSGFGSATFQWQGSNDNITFTDIPGATNSSYATPTLTTTTFYKVFIKNSAGIFCTSPQFTMNVVAPQVTGITGGSRCGTGTVVLGAAGNAGSTLNWYQVPTGGVKLGTGTSFTTPVITSSTSFYVAAAAGGSGSTFSVGPTSTAIGSNGAQALEYYLTFDVTANNMTMEGVYVYPGAAGTVKFYIAANDGLVLYNISWPVTASDINVKTYIPVNFTIPFGSNYRIGYSVAAGGVSMYRNSGGAVYPYTLPGIVSITGNSFVGYPTYYYYFYDWKVRSGCESTRTAVMANVTPGPSILPTATPSTICAGQSSALNVTSSNPNYTYLWMPGNLSGALQTVYPAGTTIYTAMANDLLTGCNASESVAVTVLPTPSEITVTPAAPAINAGTIQQLAATGGVVNISRVFGNGTTTNAATGYPSPYNNYFGGSKHQMLILASELTAAGIPAGAPINSIMFTVTGVGSTFSGSLNNFQIDMAHTTSTVLSGASFIGGLTNALPPVTVPIAVGTVTHALSTPFVWDGSRNLVIQTSYSNGNAGTSTDFVQMTNTDPGFVSTNWYRADNETAAMILAATTPTSFGNARPNMVLGYLMPTTMVWTPYANLYTDAGATSLYNGESMTTVYSKPAATITYLATATAPSTGCARTKTVTVTVLPPCEMPSAVTSSAVTSTTATISWTAPVQAPGNGYEYEVRTSGAPGSGQTGLSASGATQAISATVVGLSPNTIYHVYVRSNCGDNTYSIWTSDYSFTTLSDPLSVTGTVTNTLCNSTADGAISTTVSGGFPPYSYLWNIGETTSSVTGLSAGFYNVTVTDLNSYEAIGSWMVTEPSEVSWRGQTINISCHGANDGAISTIMTQGGTPPYYYLWSNGATTPNISGLQAGRYDISITDSHNCLIFSWRNIYEPAAIGLTAATTPASCPTGNDGGVVLSVTGGTGEYAFLWSNGATTMNISGLNPGNYGVTVTDERYCVATGIWTVGQTSTVCSNIYVTGQITTTECYNATNTITVAGDGTTFVVQPAGSATFIAGVKILYKEGTKVHSGGYLLGKITQTGQFCTSKKIAEVIATGQEEAPFATVSTFFNLYPNPTNGNFTLVQMGDRIYSKVKVEVYTMSGEKVHTENIIGVMKHEFRFNDMPGGLYFVRVVADDYVETIKLVKTR